MNPGRIRLRRTGQVVTGSSLASFSGVFAPVRIRDEGTFFYFRLQDHRSSVNEDRYRFSRNRGGKEGGNGAGRNKKRPDGYGVEAWQGLNNKIP